MKGSRVAGAPMQRAVALPLAFALGAIMAPTVDWEILRIAQAGDVVLTERVDQFVINGKDVSLPVMGAFELVGGKIAAWRDYFDLAPWQRQTAR